MELAELILKYIEALKYPALLVFLIIYFRKQLRLLLSGKLSAKYKDLEVTLEQTSEELHNTRELKKVFVEEIEKKVEQLTPATSQEPIVTAITSLLNTLRHNLTFWETQTLKAILQCDKQPVAKNLVYASLFNDPDPYAFSMNARTMREGLESLLAKGLIQKETVGRMEYFRSHPLLSEKKTELSNQLTPTNAPTEPK